MGMKLIKSQVRMTYKPLPIEAPEVEIYYNRIPEKEAKEMREKFGRNVLNPLTKKYEFEIQDNDQFAKALLEKVIVGWKNMYDESENLLDFSRAAEYVEFLPPWLVKELLNRAFGITADGEIENLLVHEKREVEAKNS